MSASNPVPSDKPASLAEALQAEITRVRDEVLAAFIQLRDMNLPNVITAPQIAMIQHELDVAVKALAESDVIQCMRSYESLKGYEA
jgi:hypothetical protein